MIPLPPLPSLSIELASLPPSPLSPPTPLSPLDRRIELRVLHKLQEETAPTSKEVTSAEGPAGNAADLDDWAWLSTS